MRKGRDAEAELNMPAGFRFHPTDEELIVHYLCRKAAGQCLPVSIIAEVDLYKYNPWELPDKAMFGNKEWYFFTPRDRKYPNGSRPNRAVKNGYWKATGADKLISTPGNSCQPIGIKKALVFYNGKAPKGIKTDWIMHEYRLANPNQSTKRDSSLRLDDWVLCRLYNKKNKSHMKIEENLPEIADSEVEHDGVQELKFSYADCIDNSLLQAPSGGIRHKRSEDGIGMQIVKKMKEDINGSMDFKVDDLQSCLESGFHELNQDYSFSAIESPTVVKWIAQMNKAPFCSSTKG